MERWLLSPIQALPRLPSVKLINEFCRENLIVSRAHYIGVAQFANASNDTVRERAQTALRTVEVQPNTPRDPEDDAPDQPATPGDKIPTDAESLGQARQSRKMVTPVSSPK